MKRFLPYILILIVLAGLFSPIINVNAQFAGVCWSGGLIIPSTLARPITNQAECTRAASATPSGGRWWQSAGSPPPPHGPVVTPPTKPPNEPSDTETIQTPTTGTSPTTNYVLLAPLPCEEGSSPGCKNGKLESYDPSGTTPLGKYLNTMLRIFIAICGVLAMIMIVVGGLEYMMSELISSKESGKTKIQGAVLGLLLALGSYAILNTINPDLLKSDSDNLTDVKVEVKLQDLGGEAVNTPFIAINSATLQARGINCDGNGGKPDAVLIGQQFIGKSTYSMSARNTTNASTIFTDCSSFVAQVYACAGLPNPGGTTAAMFSNGNGILKINGTTFDFDGNLNPGDLLGWKAGDNGSGKKVEGNGHVMIYLGGGKVLHSSSTAGGVTISNLSDYQSRATYIKRL